MPTRQLTRPTVAAVVSVLIAAGCTGADGHVNDTVSATPTSTSSSTSQTTTTSTPTTSSTSTTLAPDPDTAVRNVHTRFMTELFVYDEFKDGPEARLPLARELSTGTQLARFESVAKDRIQSGDRGVNPGNLSNIVKVEISGGTATVTDCSQGRGVLYSSTRKVLVPADDFYKLRVTRLRLIEGRWYVEDFLTGGDNRCTP